MKYKIINLENNLIDEFEVQDDDGNIYVLNIFEEVEHRKYEVFGGSSGIKQFRIKHVYTSTGSVLLSSVNRIDDNNYEIFEGADSIKVTRI